MKLKLLCECLEAAWPLKHQESYDNVGLLLGHPEDEVHRGLFCLDFTEAVLDEALREGCEVIISHHPLIFKPLKRIDSRGLIARALREGVAVYAAHTNFDKGPRGVSMALAQRLGLCEPQILRLESAPGETPYGLGAYGRLEKPMDSDAFLRFLKSQLNLSTMKHSAIHKPLIETVAVCGGAGSELMSEARQVAADAFVCADTHYHDFDLGSSDPLLIDMGHYESEIMAIDVLCMYVTEKLPTFATLKSCVDTNFVRYF